MYMLIKQMSYKYSHSGHCPLPGLRPFLPVSTPRGPPHRAAHTSLTLLLPLLACGLPHVPGKEGDSFQPFTLPPSPS